MKGGKRHATLSDVANSAGVGTTTVSRVINGGEKVSAETLARVQSAIAELEFIPNHAARTLRGEQTKTIGLIVPSIADSFFSSCAEAIQKVARRQGTLLILAVTNNDPAVEIATINTLLRRTDGLLLVPTSSHDRDLRSLLRDISIPVICIDRPINGIRIQAVVTENFEGARAATRHLLQHGFRRILCLGGESDLFTMNERVRGYSAAMKEAKAQPLIDMKPTDRDYGSTSKAIAKHLSSARPPEAIFCLKNSTTISTYSVLRKMKVSVPSQIALIGFDDFELASTLRPSITVVQQPIEELGNKAAKLLFQCLDLAEGRRIKEQGKIKPIQLKTRLILRASCGCSEAEEPLSKS
jgi:LacI family transcriptional regulator